MIAAWLLLLAATGCDKPAAPTPETPPVVVTEPQTFYVDAAAASGGDGSLERPFLTLAEALTVADEGDTIQLAPGRYAECPVIESGVELIGSSLDSVVIDCADAVTGLVIRAAVVRIEGLTLRGGVKGIVVEPDARLIARSIRVMSSIGVGIDVDGELQAQDLEIIGVTAGVGDDRGFGLRANSGSRVVWVGGRLSASAADGLRSVDSAVDLTDVIVEGNGDSGLSLQAGLDARVDNCTIRNNAQTGIFVGERTLELTNSQVESNPYGVLTSPGSKLTIEKNRFEKNGEGVAVVGSTGSVRENLFRENSDGALSIQNAGSAGFQVELNSFIDNWGHAIHLSYCNVATVDNNDIQGTRRVDDPAFGLVLGDGISLLESVATLTSNRIVSSEGAGIYGQYSRGELKNNTVLGNLEGGVFLTDNVDELWTIDSNTLDGNVGGGIVARNSRFVAIHNTIRDSKHSAQYQVGDGIALLERIGPSEIRENTIERSAGNGIGVYLSTQALIENNELQD
ncbi:MAG: right-handed parallel beta-helix repeat-containing protein, partial [Myxococcales bacterium]|nr:right-handed parallel beta-helix repeat-containing protein [Myxococcales bacterium]